MNLLISFFASTVKGGVIAGLSSSLLLLVLFLVTSLYYFARFTGAQHPRRYYSVVWCAGALTAWVVSLSLNILSWISFMFVWADEIKFSFFIFGLIIAFALLTVFVFLLPHFLGGYDDVYFYFLGEKVAWEKIQDFVVQEKWIIIFYKNERNRVLKIRVWNHSRAGYFMVKEHDHFKKLIAKHEVSVESKNANSTLADELLSKTTPTIDIDSAIDDLNTPAKTETVAKVSEQPQFPQFDADEPLTDIPTNTEEQELIDDQPTPTIDIDSAIEDLNTQAKTEAVDKAPEQPEQTFDTNELTEIPSINNKEITEDESPGKLPKSKDSSSSKDK